MSKNKFIVIALDGGAASGKSSTSKVLAQKLNLLHVDTGTHYRSISFFLLQENIYPSNHDVIVNKLGHFKIDSKIVGRDALLSINNRVLTDEELRSPLVSQHVSLFSAIPELRHFLLEYQRSQVKLAADHGFHGLIMDGRDIGSVVLPNANFRFFLEADPHTRYNRRLQQGFEDSIAARDKLDSTRANAPLVCPPGAIRIDTSHTTLDEAANHILDIILSKLDKPTTT